MVKRKAPAGAATAVEPRIVHETACRIRFRWNRLLDPGLEPDYLGAWLGNLPGVDRVRVNPQGRCIVVEYDGRPEHRQKLLAGFGRIPKAAFERKAPAPPKRRLIDLAASGIMAAALPYLPRTLQGVVAGAMALPPILKGIDTLVNEGLKDPVRDLVTISLSMLRADFKTAASMSAMTLVDDYVGHVTDDRSNALLKSLTADPVDHVRVDRDGETRRIDFHDLRKGDVVYCNSGDMIVVDGEVAEGEGAVDAGFMTGDSTPCVVRPGSRVDSGGVVIEGRFKVRAVRTGPETNMARISEYIIKAVNDPPESEMKSERLADSMATITFGLGAALYAVSRDLERALSVIAVDFGSNVKIPAPVVVKASMYAAAKQGVHIKSGAGLENLGEADCVLFDVSGALTRGEMSVTDVVMCSDNDEDAFLRMIVALEEGSDHPIGLGLKRELARRGLESLAATELMILAQGVSGNVDGEMVCVGSRRHVMKTYGVECSAVAERAEELRVEGKTLVYAAKGKRLEGVVALKDTIRPEAEGVLAWLRKDGFKKVVAITGDHASTAKAIVGELPHVDELRAECSPEDKARAVQEFAGKGFKVAVVGNGVNDAPAFTAAHVGVCMSRGRGLARESAQVVLGEDNLDGLRIARTYAKRAGRTLQHCFNVGLGMDAGLLSAAGAGLLKPATTAGLQNLTTAVLVGNAARASLRTLPDDVDVRSTGCDATDEPSQSPACSRQEDSSPPAGNNS